MQDDIFASHKLFGKHTYTSQLSDVLRPKLKYRQKVKDCPGLILRWRTGSKIFERYLFI